MSGAYVLGVDYGTDSARAVLVSTADGAELSSGVCAYPRWSEGKFCDASANQFRQHPQDYIDALLQSVSACLRDAPEGSAAEIAAISIDTTGSTPVAVDKDGVALAMREDFADNPNAMFILWKDHTGLTEADQINTHARTWGGTDFTSFSGGIYSSEWFWSKILRTLRVDEAVRKEAFSWMEHCDWLPGLLTGNTDPLKVKRSRCAAGHKAMWHESWGGLPSEDFLSSLDPLLAGLRDRLYTETFTSDQSAGNLTEEWAQKLGLPAGIPVGVGAFDAHMGAVGAQITDGTLIKVIGTSTCDMAVATEGEISGKQIPGICGQVDGSILPGFVGLEAGQSAFGDLYAWYKDLLNWPTKEILKNESRLDSELKNELIRKISDLTLARLNEAAAKIPLKESDPVALDWINGRRTPGADQTLKLAMCGVAMGTDAPAMFKALVEATAYGNRRIINHLEENGVRIEQIVAIGGIARKSAFVMQTCADVLGKPIAVAESDQCCALGAAVFAAVLAGIYPDTSAAQQAMGSKVEKTFTPDMQKFEIYEKLYKRYLELGVFAQSVSKS